MNTDLKKRYEEIQLSMATRGHLSEYLPPHLWEDFRQRLQQLYRKATGEKMAVLLVQEDLIHHAAEARVAELEARLAAAEKVMDACREMADDYQSSEHHHPHHVLVSLTAFNRMRCSLENIENTNSKSKRISASCVLSKLISYVPEECFEGDTRWELVKCDRPGGAWFGAEDFRAARAFMEGE